MPKRVRVALLGSGKDGDSYRVSLPTYFVVSVDYGAMTAVVDIPDEACPPVLSAEPVTVSNIPQNGPCITGLTQLQKGKTAVYFDTKYAEHAGKFWVDAK